MRLAVAGTVFAMGRTSGGAAMMGRIDRYIWRAMTLRFLAVVGIVVAILTLENLTRLTADVEKTLTPFKLLGWLSLCLVPEQASAAVPIALFLGVALGARQLMLRGEWAILAASGMGRRRIMIAPMALGLLAGGVQLGDRLELQPAGERSLDALYLSIQTGALGVPVSLDAPIQLDPTTMVMASPLPGGPAGALTRVVVRHGDQMFTAPHAQVTALAGSTIALDLFDGDDVSGLSSGRPRSVSFERMRVFGHPSIISLVGNDPRHRLGRQNTAGLIALAQGTSADAAPAKAALTMRIDDALFCLMVPWLALVLGLPPRRGATAFGLGWGIVLVVAHLKSAAFVEDSFAHHAVVAGVLHAIAWAVVTLLVVRAEARFGEGFAEAATQRAIRQVTAAIGRVRRGGVTRATGTATASWTVAQT